MSSPEHFHIEDEVIEYNVVSDGEVWTFDTENTNLFFFDHPTKDYSEQEHIYFKKPDGNYVYIFNTDGRAKPHMEAMMRLGFTYTIARKPSDQDIEYWLAIQDKDIEGLNPEDLK